MNVSLGYIEMLSLADAWSMHSVSVRFRETEPVSWKLAGAIINELILDIP